LGILEDIMNVTRRAVAIGLIAGAMLCAVTPYNDCKIGATNLAGNQFPVGAIFILFLFAVPINALLARFTPRWLFARAELLTIWVLILVASGLPSSGLMRFLLPHLAAPPYFSNKTNNWEARVWGNLPAGFRITDKDAATAYYMGYPRGAEHIPWEAWWQPLLVWGVFGLCFFTVTFCLTSLLRRQWIENEKFVFPLVTLPLLITQSPPTFLRSRPLVIAVTLTTALHGLNGLHQLYPAIPGVPLSFPMDTVLTTPPWNQVGNLPVNVYPLVIGLTYLLASEVAFSLWFFFLVHKAEILFAVVYNWYAPASLGSPAERQFSALQGFGGAIALLGWTLWTARRHLAILWRDIDKKDKKDKKEDNSELLSPRATIYGLIFGYMGMGLWLYVAQVPMFLILTSLLTITISLVTISWLVSQAGTLFTIPSCMTIDSIGGILGTQGASPGAWYTVQRVECIFYRDTRELLLAELLSGTKVAESGNFSAKSLFRAMLAAVVLSVVVSLVASLWLPYYNGGANTLTNIWAFRTGPMRPLNLTGSLANTPLPFVPSNGLHVAGGFAGVLTLLLLRARYGVGLHPIGFIGASVYSSWMLWFSILLGWLAKTLLLRFGGLNLYRIALPFFLGLILGDVLNAMLWIVIGAMTGVGYSILPQ
jgi:hypothetical protein